MDFHIIVFISAMFCVICVCCGGCKQVIKSLIEAVQRFRSRDSLISEILFLKISPIYILFYCLCHLVELEVGGGG